MDSGSNCTIENCYSEAEIICNDGWPNIGGIVGYLSGGLIKDSSSKVTISHDKGCDIGGIVGTYHRENDDDCIQNCNSETKIIIKDTQSFHGRTCRRHCRSYSWLYR